jgi:hypothetical protein
MMAAVLFAPAVTEFHDVSGRREGSEMKNRTTKARHEPDVDDWHAAMSGPMPLTIRSTDQYLAAVKRGDGEAARRWLNDLLIRHWGGDMPGVIPIPE